MRRCKNCKSEIFKKNNVFCNNFCQNDYQYKKYICKWLGGEVNGIRGKFYLSKHIRKYLIYICEGKCQKCGWNKINPITSQSPLEIHHKNGDSLDNSFENLEVLCPNCHSLTNNYKSLNSKSQRIRKLFK